MPKKVLIKVAKTNNGTSVNYEPFGDSGSLIEDAFEFGGKTPQGQNIYKGRTGTAWQDVHFITDPTSKKSSLFLMKEGKLIPTEATNLNPDEVLKIRNKFGFEAVERAKRLAGNIAPATSLGNASL